MVQKTEDKDSRYVTVDTRGLLHSLSVRPGSLVPGRNADAVF